MQASLSRQHGDTRQQGNQFGLPLRARCAKAKGVVITHARLHLELNPPSWWQKTSFGTGFDRATSFV